MVYASASAESSAAGSLPPASARSGRPPPLPPTLLRHWTNYFSGLHAAGEVLGYAHDERDVSVRRRAQHNDAGTDLIAKLIDERAHLRALQVIHAMREDLDAFHIFNFVADVRRASTRRISCAPDRVPAPGA